MNTKLDLSLLGNTQYGSLEEENAICGILALFICSALLVEIQANIDSNGMPMNTSKMEPKPTNDTSVMQFCWGKQYTENCLHRCWIRCNTTDKYTTRSKEMKLF